MSFLEELQKRKSVLKPTETIVRPMPVCQSGLEEHGLDCLGGEIEPERSEAEEITAKAGVACAEALKNAKHAVVYTGAGVSTATGISDYRGPDGVWTALAQGRIPDDWNDWTAAKPSYTHMSIAKLVQAGYVKFVTSTNLDALHLKSGLMPLQNLAELHGSKFVERCSNNKCQEEVVRTFPIRRSADRNTGRTCPACGSSYMDSSIDFGQNLPKKHLKMAEEQAEKSDFSLVLGTSMRVRPASEIPFLGEAVTPEGPDGHDIAQVCIVNKQDTPFDKRTCLRSYGNTELFFYHLMRELDLQVDVPPEVPLKTATEMKKLAEKFLPPRDGHYVGEEETERLMAKALDQAEAELLAVSPS